MLSGVIKSFRTGARNGVYYVTRAVDAGFTDEGYPIAPTTSQVRIEASVQPLGNDQVQALPDGVRAEDTRLLFTTTPLFPTSPTVRADIVAIDGERWAVLSVVGPWQLGKSIHYEVVVKKQTEGNAS